MNYARQVCRLAAVGIILPLVGAACFGQAVSVPLSVDSRYNVLRYGARGDGTTDDLAALDRAEAACPVGGTIYLPAGTYLISDTWTVPATKGIVCEPGTWIVCDTSSTFTADRPIVSYENGTTNVANTGGIRGGLNIRDKKATAANWSSAAFCALQIRNCSQRSFELGKIQHVASGLKMYAGDGESCGMNRITADEFRTCKRAVRLEIDGTGWINSNHFKWGETANVGAVTPAEDACAAEIRQTSGTTNNLDKNHFEVASMEVATSGTESLAWLYAGKNNTFTVGHTENLVYMASVFATEGAVTGNAFYARSPAGTTTQPPGIYPPQSAPGNEWWGNVVYSSTNPQPGREWHSGNLADLMYEVDGAGAVAFPGVALVGWNTGVIAASDNGPTVYAYGGAHSDRAVDFPNDHYPAIYVDTTKHKTLRVSFQPPDGISQASYPRIAIAAFQSDGTKYLPNSNSADAFRVTFREGAPTAILGNGWSLPGAAQTATRTVSVDDTVAYILVAISGGSKCKSFSIATPPGTQVEEPLHVWTTLRDRGQAMGTAAPATKGTYPLGFRIANRATGATLGWRCTTAGTMAPAWAPSTAYVAGQLVKNDTNKIYVCVTAGTSAGSGGPTGTGTAIADGTAVWNYYDALAVFTAETGN